ncbi:MAG: cytidylate kinase-like family protein [Thermodesulfobacteriota bacterium]|nr:cytidylate kinase-like family protein [Thermodesulfobacteriota bacterium]
MSIITIFANSYSKGEELAEKVGKKMGYEYVNKHVLLSAATKEFGMPESKLTRAIKDTPSILDMFSNGTQRSIAYMEAVLAEYMLKDDIVYHGRVGHPIVQGISHVLKVQIIAKLEDRIGLKTKQEHMSPEKTRKIILAEDAQRKKWAKAIYDIDITDPGLYDLVINVGRLEAEDAEDAVETIISTVKHKKFQPMTYSLNCMKDVALSCHLKAVLINTDSTIQLKSHKGTVFVYTRALKRKKQRQVLDFKERIMAIDGVEHVEVYTEKDLFLTMARGQ